MIDLSNQRAQLEVGHGPGKAAPETLAPQARHARARDEESRAHGWPRLLDERQAAAYLGVSCDLIAEYVRAELLHVVRLPRPDTPRDRRRAVGDFVRRRLLDRADLDAFVDRLKAGAQ